MRVGVLPIEPASIRAETQSNKTHMIKNIKIVVIGGSGLIGNGSNRSLELELCVSWAVHFERKAEMGSET
jgi:hypothetical protein